MFKKLLSFGKSKAKCRKVKIVAPKAPSGVAWLINALICLGIRVGRTSSPDPGTFVKDDKGFFQLHHAESNLKLHFPVLAEMDQFIFREDVIVEWTHDWVPTNETADDVFIFVRDPRDALFSFYKRRNATVSFGEFVRSLDYVTLMSQVDNWRMYIDSWMARGNVTLLRFEDFKKQPELHLSRLLSKIGIDQIDPHKMKHAVRSSKVENARRVEEVCKEKMDSYFKSNSPLNRKGMLYEWKSQFDQYQKDYQYIEQKCIKQLADFGYEYSPEIGPPPAMHLSANGLAYNQVMPEINMTEWIAKIDVDQKASILSFYEDFLDSNDSRYGFYEEWEREILEKNIRQFIRLILPDLYASNSVHASLALTSLALNFLRPNGQETIKI